MAHLAAVATLVLVPVLGFRTVSGEMAHLLAVAADDHVWITWLVTFLGDMIGRPAVAAGTRLDIGTL